MMRWKKILLTSTFLFLLFLIGGVFYLAYSINNSLIEQNSEKSQYVIDTLADSEYDKIEESRVLQAAIEKEVLKENPKTSVTGPIVVKKKDTNPISNDPKDEIANKENKDPVLSTPKNPTLTQDDNSATTPSTEISSTIQKKVGQPIDPADLVQAVSILLRKLSIEEISFMLGITDSSRYTNEELTEIRKLLLNKLSPEDISTLTVLANKYGKYLQILNPDIPIENLPPD